MSKRIVSRNQDETYVVNDNDSAYEDVSELLLDADEQPETEVDDFNEIVSLSTLFNDNSGIDSPSTHYFAIQTGPFEDTLLKNYIIKVWKRELKNPVLQFTRFVCLQTTMFSSHPNYTRSTELDMYLTVDPILQLSVIYENKHYEVCFVVVRDTDVRSNEYYYEMKITGMSKDADKPSHIYNLLLSAAVSTSSFSRKALQFDLSEESTHENSFMEKFKEYEASEISLSNIFLPENKKEEIERFIYAVENYSTDKINLRYLLNGDPGTGKTQIIRSIISALKGKATIIVSQGSNFPMKAMFRFCKYFSPVVLIVDDIDFVAGARGSAFDRGDLGTFLQHLDGFLPESLFILGATNDKKLIDEAASRPGRFDMILDVAEIQKENYLDLIRRETLDEEIIEFFTLPILSKMTSRKVTGAFIVSLIKQLTSRKKMKGNLSHSEFSNFFDLQHKGFYAKNSEPQLEFVGFGN